MNHGAGGVIQMGGQGESLYYSMSSLSLEGQLVGNRNNQLAQGHGWLDHQWGSWGDYMARWTWFCIQLSNQTQIMVYIFANDCSGEDKTTITLQRANGSCLGTGKLLHRVLDRYKSQQSGITYPTRHELQFEIDNQPYQLLITALNQEQEIRSQYVDYWEGPCKVKGTVGHVAISGTGFCEIIGRYVYAATNSEV